ncbi:MAG: hypothetical protein EPN57_18310 [Paraburkholderia sp.]|nr:MAG: hypothetical protein EPN57_18310 [Paraburkholderia sp.]
MLYVKMAVYQTLEPLIDRPASQAACANWSSSLSEFTTDEKAAESVRSSQDIRHIVRLEAVQSNQRLEETESLFAGELLTPFDAPFFADG